MKICIQVLQVHAKRVKLPTLWHPVRELPIYCYVLLQSKPFSMPPTATRQTEHDFIKDTCHNHCGCLLQAIYHLTSCLPERHIVSQLIWFLLHSVSIRTFLFSTEAYKIVYYGSTKVTVCACWTECVSAVPVDHISVYLTYVTRADHNSIEFHKLIDFFKQVNKINAVSN